MSIEMLDPKMGVKEAVSRAKHYVADLFEGENLTNLGLEEVERDTNAGVWRVTVGFSKPWNTARNAFTAISGEPIAKRAYRVVTINNDGEVTSVKRRNTIDE